VVFTFERILNQEIGAQRRGFVQEVASVEKVGETTVRFNLKCPWPVFLQMLVHNQVVPKDYVTQAGDAEFARKPVGAGPFKFVEGDLNEQIVLERFDDYYGGADALPPVGPPYLDRVTFRMIPDVSTRVEALSAGEVHIIQNVPAYMVPRLVNNPDVTIKTTVGTRPKFMDLNVTISPFDDVRVRQALNYAVDADEILAKVASGYGVTLPGPLSPANLYADPDLNPRVDELITAGASEPDPERRREIYYEMQRLVYKDAPAIFLYVPQEIEAASARVHNWEPSPDSRVNLHDVWLSE